MLWSSVIRICLILMDFFFFPFHVLKQATCFQQAGNTHCHVGAMRLWLPFTRMHSTLSSSIQYQDLAPSEWEIPALLYGKIPSSLACVSFSFWLFILAIYIFFLKSLLLGFLSICNGNGRLQCLFNFHSIQILMWILVWIFNVKRNANILLRYNNEVP